MPNRTLSQAGMAGSLEMVTPIKSDYYANANTRKLEPFESLQWL